MKGDIPHCVTAVVLAEGGVTQALPVVRVEEHRREGRTSKTAPWLG